MLFCHAEAGEFGKLRYLDSPPRDMHLLDVSEEVFSSADRQIALRARRGPSLLSRPRSSNFDGSIPSRRCTQRHSHSSSPRTPAISCGSWTEFCRQVWATQQEGEELGFINEVAPLGYLRVRELLLLESPSIPFDVSVNSASGLLPNVRWCLVIGPV